MKALVIKNLEKKYGNIEVLKKINLEVEQGEFISLLGPSGCGKTTTLRIVAGLLDATSGDVIINEKNVEGVPVHKRNNGMVFQNYALFPHLTVSQNIEYGLKQHKVPKEERKKKVQEGLEMVHLEFLGNRYPKQLSGGQQQRVALARALVMRPNLLLLDEPLSNLDAKLREEMQIEIRNIQKKLNVTTLFVTHDQKEALSMSDKIAVMNKGVIEQLGTPEELYENPKTEFVSNFIGYSNIFRGIYPEKKEGVLYTESNYGNIIIQEDKRFRKDDRFIGSLRPERLKISRTKEEADNCLECTVLARVYVGTSIQLTVKIENELSLVITVTAPDEKNNLLVGEKGYVYWNAKNMKLIEAVYEEVFE